MAPPITGGSAQTNRILDTLSPEELERLAADLEPSPLRYRATLFDVGDRMEYVYFPSSGVVSTLVTMENGDSVEFAVVGREGVVNFFAQFGTEISPTKAIVQVPGDSQRLRIERFRWHLERLPRLERSMSRLAEGMFALVAQGAACNRLHSLNERAARWLLSTHDRVEGDEFPMTQEFMAHMLGVRRPSVTVAMGVLQDSGLVDFRRGRVTICQRAQLEAAACECYGTVRRRFDGLFPQLQT